MKLLKMTVIFLVVGTVSSQVEKKTPGTAQPKWQKVDQLCGQLELTKATAKTIIVNGKREKRSYVMYLSDAEVVLYRGADSDTRCCGRNRPLAHTLSSHFGAFELQGLGHGLYWLQVKKGDLRGEIPLLATEDFNARKCRAPEVGRSFVVDSKTPTVQVRIR